LSFSFTNVRADNWFNLSYNGNGNLKNSIFYNLEQDSGTTLVDGILVTNLYFYGGELQKVTDIQVSELSWNGGTLSGPGTMTLSIVSNITTNANNQLTGGTYLNLGNTTFYTNPNITSGQPCLTINGAVYENAGGYTNASANCLFGGNGQITLVQGNIYAGKNLTVNPLFAINPTQSVPYADNLTVVYTTISNTIYLNGDPSMLNGTLYVYVDRKFSPGDTINLIDGNNIEGSFMKVIFDPQPTDSNGNPIKYTIKNMKSRYVIEFSGSGRIIGGLLLMIVLLFLF